MSVGSRGVLMAKKILIVDDEPDVVTFLSTLLRRVGYETITASDAEEGLEKVRSEKPDLISLDLLLPHKTGINLLQELRTNKETSSIPIVVVTGFHRENVPQMDFKEWFQENFARPPEAYIEKPVDKKNFLAAIRREIGRGKITSGLRLVRQKGNAREACHT
jgi:CheY-like chemotaxis protein